mgnify:CR=1 FL=1
MAGVREIFLVLTVTFLAGLDSGFARGSNVDFASGTVDRVGLVLFRIPPHLQGDSRERSRTRQDAAFALL